jgi:dihydrofolate reductase
MKISLIYAQNEDGAIGLAGPHPLPWHHPEDLERFKKLTMGKGLLMGMNTFDSLPRLLPGRFHFVLTRGKGLPRLGRLASVQFLNSIAGAVIAAEELDMEELFVIGGASILNTMLGKADTIYRTMVLNTPLATGDLAKVHMPERGESPQWDKYKCVKTEYVEDRLVFLTYELKHQG